MYIRPSFKPHFFEEFVKPPAPVGTDQLKAPVTYSKSKYGSFAQFQNNDIHRADFQACGTEYAALIDALADFVEKNAGNVKPTLLENTVKSVQKSLAILKDHVLNTEKDFFSDHKPLIFGAAKEMLHELEKLLQDDKFPIQNRLNAIIRMAPQLETCTGGMVTVLGDEITTLKYGKAGLKGAAYLVKLQMIRHLITLHVKNNHDYAPRNEVHYINAYFNHLADELGVSKVDDLMVSVVEKDIEPLLSQCRDSVLQKLKPSALASSLGDRYLDLVKNAGEADPGQRLTGVTLRKVFHSINVLHNAELIPGFGEVSQANYLIPADTPDGEIGFQFARNPALLASEFMHVMRRQELLDFGDTLTLTGNTDGQGVIKMLGNLFWRDDDGACTEVMARELLQLLPGEVVARLDQAGIPPEAQGELLASWTETILSAWESEKIADIPDAWLDQLGELQRKKIIDADEIVPAMLLAAIYDKPAALQNFIDEHGNPEGTDIDGNTALILAAKHGNLDSLRILLDSGADLSTVNVEGVSAAMLAASNGHTEALKLLIERGANINACNGQGMTVTMFAAQNGHAEAVKMLIEAGATIHGTDVNERNALMLAIETGNLETQALLLEHGAWVDAVDVHGNSAAFYAAAKNRSGSLRLLARHGADFGLANDFACTPLMCSAEFGHHEAMRVLLEQDIDLDSADLNDCTALMYACGSGNIETAALLLGKSGPLALQEEKKVIIDLPDKDGYSALTYAARAGKLEVVKLLLDHEVFIELPDNQGATAFMHAVRNGHLETARLLAAAGAEVDATNNHGVNAFMTAAAAGDTTMMAFLLAELEGKVDLQAFINRGNYHGTTAAMYAAQNGQTAALQKLIDLGADLHQTNYEGADALMFAAQNDHGETVDLLLANRADPNTRKRGGETALILAIYGNHIHSALSLMEAGANLRAISDAGISAMSVAASANNTRLLLALIEHGLDIEEPDPNGRSCMSWAAEHGNLDVLKVLLKHGARADQATAADLPSPIMVSIDKRQDQALRLLLESLQENSAGAWIRSAAAGRLLERAERDRNAFAVGLLKEIAARATEPPAAVLPKNTLRAWN